MAERLGQHAPCVTGPSWPRTSMAPRTICDRMTPLLPRAPMSAACEMAAHTSRLGQVVGQLGDGLDHASAR